MAKGIVSGDSKRELIWSSHPLSDLNLYQLPGQNRLYPAPLPDELLTSWLCRIARINRSPLRTLLIAIREQNFGYLQGTSKKVFWNLDFDVECPSDLMATLSEITGIPQARIEELTLKSVVKRVNSELIVKHSTRILGGLRFCPQCLKSDAIPYYRKSWRLKFFTACPIHQIHLLDRCPRCKKPLRITELNQNAPFFACYSCKLDFRTIVGENLPDGGDAIKIQEELLSIAHKGSVNGNESNLYFEALHFLIRFVVLVYPLNSPFFEQKFPSIDNNRIEFLKQRNFIYEDIPLSQYVIQKAHITLNLKDQLRELISRNQTLFNYLTQKQCPILLQPYRLAKEFNKLTGERITFAVKEIIKKKKPLTYTNVAREVKCDPTFYLSHPELRRIVDSYREGQKKHLYERASSTLSEISQTHQSITLSKFAQLIDCPVSVITSDPHLRELVYEKFCANFSCGKPNATTKRVSKVSITTESVTTAIELLREQGEKVSFAGVARKLGVSSPVIIKNPELNEIVVRASETKSKHRKSISINIVQQAIMEIQKNNSKLTLKTLAEHIGCNYWSLRDDPTISSLIKLAQGQRIRRNYDDITPEKVNGTIASVKESGKFITVNEVGRQLNCTKLVFRNKPQLKELILKAKECQVQELHSQFHEKYHLSYPIEEINRYSEIFDEYKKQMTEQGRDWHVSKNETTAKKLGIPIAIFLNFKFEECPNTKKRIKAEVKDAFLNVDNLRISDETKLSPESQQYEAQFLKYIQEMNQKGKDWRASRNGSISKKLGIPIAICFELKRYFNIKSLLSLKS